MEVGYGKFQRILTVELEMKLVQRILTVDEKQERADVYMELRWIVSEDATFL